MTKFNKIDCIRMSINNYNCNIKHLNFPKKLYDSSKIKFTDKVSWKKSKNPIFSDNIKI